MTRSRFVRPERLRMLRLPLLILVLLLSFSSIASAQSTFAVRDFSVDNGGGVSRGGRYVMTGVVGQPDAQTSSGGSFTMMGGLLDPEPWRAWLPNVDR